MTPNYKSRLAIPILLAVVACRVVAIDPVPGSADGAAGSTDQSVSDIRRNYDLALGKAVFTGKCMACHGEVLSSAPQYGDYEAWEGRITQTIDTLVQHALSGHGDMPAKGGFASLSDEEVGAAVAYVVDRSQRMIANREVTETDCTRVEENSRCSSSEFERTMVLQLLWLLSGPASDGGN